MFFNFTFVDKNWRQTEARHLLLVGAVEANAGAKGGLRRFNFVIER